MHWKPESTDPVFSLFGPQNRVSCMHGSERHSSKFKCDVFPKTRGSTPVIGVRCPVCANREVFTRDWSRVDIPRLSYASQVYTDMCVGFRVTSIVHEHTIVLCVMISNQEPTLIYTHAYTHLGAVYIRSPVSTPTPKLT